MSYSDPKRLRAEDGLYEPLREALRELPNSDPTAAQLESLRLRLGARAAARNEELPIQELPLSSPRRHTPARKLRRTIAALVLFPVAATAAVGGFVELVQRATTQRSLPPTPRAAELRPNQRQHGVAGAAESTASVASPPSPIAADDEPPSAAEVAPASQPNALRTATSVATDELPEKPPPPAVSGAPPVAAFDTAPSTSLAAETALLQRANAALKADPATALALVAQHRQAFPEGKLAQEREVIAIKALQALGETQRARASFASFKRSYPHSAHVLELRQIIH